MVRVSEGSSYLESNDCILSFSVILVKSVKNFIRLKSSYTKEKSPCIVPVKLLLVSLLCQFVNYFFPDGDVSINLFNQFLHVTIGQNSETQVALHTTIPLSQYFSVHQLVCMKLVLTLLIAFSTSHFARFCVERK